MLEKIVAQIALTLFNWLEKRISANPTAVDADVDRERLQRAGDRISKWMREQNDIHSRRLPDEGGSERKL